MAGGLCRLLFSGYCDGSVRSIFVVFERFGIAEFGVCHGDRVEVIEGLSQGVDGVGKVGAGFFHDLFRFIGGGGPPPTWQGVFVVYFFALAIAAFHSRKARYSASLGVGAFSVTFAGLR